MSTDTKHSPPPWRVDSDNPNEIHGPRHFIGVLESDGSDAEDAANAAHAVACVNGTDERTRALVEALTRCAAFIGANAPETLDSNSPEAVAIRAASSALALAKS